VRDQRALIAHCTVELWATWHNFSRSLYLASAFRARESAGRRVTLGITPPASEQEALGVAIQRLKPRVYAAKGGVGPWNWRDEPRWMYPSQLLDSLVALQSSNLPAVQVALSNGTRTLQDLPEFRNFFAHRDVVTLRKAQSLFVHYGHPPTERPAGVLAVPSRTSQGTGWQPLLLDWVDDIVDAVTLAVL